MEFIGQLLAGKRGIMILEALADAGHNHQTIEILMAAAYLIGLLEVVEVVVVLTYVCQFAAEQDDGP